MSLGRYTPLFIAAACLALQWSLPSGRVSAQQIDNVAVYNRASEIADDIELIREVMGRPFDDSPRLPASEVSQDELYFQAQTLFRKANQLAQDFDAAERLPAPPAPDRAITTQDIYALVDAIGEQISLVKSRLGIDTELATEVRDTPISVTGVFMLMIDMSRQLNLMLENPIRPSDVYTQVSLAASFAGGILANLQSGRAVPPLPAIEAHRVPADVYQILLRCMDVVNRIANRVGVPVVTLSSRRNIPDDIEPGHVFDIATMLVADLAGLAVALDTDGIDLNLPRPEYIFPTQVYQLSELLYAELQEIDRTL